MGELNLLPCPFCGNSAEIWAHDYPNGETFFEPLVWHEDWCILDHALWCGDYETAEELIEHWNRRLTHD